MGKSESALLSFSLSSFFSLSLERKVCRRPKIIPVGGSLKIFSTRDFVERSTKKNIVISMIWSLVQREIFFFRLRADNAIESSLFEHPL